MKKTLFLSSVKGIKKKKITHNQPKKIQQNIRKEIK